MQEALDDVRDAVSRVRSDLPADLRDPIVTKVNLAGAADPDLHRRLRRAWTTRRCPGSSTTTSPRPARGARRRRGRARRRRRRARCASSSTRCSCRRWAPPRPTSRASCARCSRKRRRPHRPRRRRAVGAHPRHGADAPPRSGRMEIALADGRRIRLDQVAHGERHGGRAALGGAARRQAGGRLRGHAQPRRERARRRRGRAARRSTS